MYCKIVKGTGKKNMLVVNDGEIYAPGCTVDVGLCGPSRARSRTALFDALPNLLTETSKNAYAMHLEACAVAYSGNDYASYMSIMSRVVYNLKSNGEYIITNYPVSKVCKLSH
jgi:hypothetical protein